MIIMIKCGILSFCVYLRKGGSVIRRYGKLADLALNFDKSDVALRPSFIAKAYTEGAVSYTILKLNKTDKL